VDKKEIVVSTVAGLAVIFVGYVVWRHEQVVGAENAQAQQEANAQQIDELNNAIASLPSGGSYAGGYGGGASNSSVQDTGSTSLQTPAYNSTGLDKILSAFYPNINSPAPAVDPSTPANNGASGNVSDFINNMLQTGTAKQTYNLVLPTTLQNYLPPSNPDIYHNQHILA
jgi:hypothetical protein